MFQVLAEITSDQVMQAVTNGGKWLIGAFSALGGVAGIASIVKAIINYKARKYNVSLSESDLNYIAEKVTDKMATGIEIDVSKQIDVATSKRLTEVEEKVNEFAELVEITNDGVCKIAKAVGEFKTISAETRNNINEFVAKESKAVEKTEVIDKVKATVEKVVEEVKSSLY